MIKYYLIIAFRNILRYKGYSFINITGLAVGMACFIFISLWIGHELSYDGFHVNANRLFRVNDYEKYADGTDLYFVTNPPELAPTLKKGYPEIIEAVRYRTLPGKVLRYRDKIFTEEGMTFVDPAFFKIFTYPFILGKPEEILSTPNSIILTREMTLKYFGTEDPMGKIIHVDNTHDFVVTGVIEDVPNSSHLQFDFAAPFLSLPVFNVEIKGWDQFAYRTYVLLRNDVDHQEFSSKIAGTIKRYDNAAETILSLQAITDIHVSGQTTTVIIFSIIAVFILLIACINYANLATARSARRMKEVGIRKATGATRREIIFQLFGESIFFSLLSFLLSMLLVILLLPSFNDLTGKEISFDFLKNATMMLLLVGTAVLVGIISGSYPAVVISAFNPAKILKGSLMTVAKRSAVRKVLVSVQFILTIVLIIGALVINRQLHFIQNQNLGYDKDRLLYLRLNGDSPLKSDLLKTEFSQDSNVLNVSAVSDPLTSERLVSALALDWEGKNVPGNVEINYFMTDYDFAETYSIPMVEGHYYSRYMSSDTASGVVLNEAAIKAIGMKSPVGKKIFDRRIIGVMKNFHFTSLHSPVKPLVVFYQPDRAKYLVIKMKGGDITNTINSLASTWKTIVPWIPFEYQFNDEILNKLYQADRRIETIVNIFTGLTLIIACLGLFGLASYTVELRTKEIGIRKTLGASTLGLTFSLVKEFSQWVLIANIAAWPIAYFMMEILLQDYAYRISMTPWIFMISGFLALTVAVLTVSYQSIRATCANPVESLRYE